jgi:hypothetical protein
MNNLENHKMFRILGFTNRWVILNLLNKNVLDSLEHQYNSDTDRHTEHFRWKVFKDYLNHKEKLTGELFEELFKLANDETDVGMGESMMVELILRDDCPFELLKKSLKSNKKSLSKVAGKILLSKEKPIK